MTIPTSYLRLDLLALAFFVLGCTSEKNSPATDMNSSGAAGTIAASGGTNSAGGAGVGAPNGAGQAGQDQSTPDGGPLPNPAPRPNVLFVLCDDLGYGNIGVFHQNQRPPGAMAHQTPNLDQLASDGMMLTQHYSGAPVCVSSRTALITGRHMGHAAVRDNQFDDSIPDDHTLATVLGEAGYRTALIGKWGLGGNASTPATGPLAGHPLNRGFDYFFGILAHVAGHVHYADAEHPVFDGLDNVSAQYAGAYSTDLYAARAKGFIAEHVQNNTEQPFFVLLAYTAPHTALQIPSGAYPQGQGLDGGLSWPFEEYGTPNSYFYPQYANATYDDDDNPNTAEVPWPTNAKRYASMVHRIDDSVGDLRQLLVDLNVADNTLIVFSSDNGAVMVGGADPRYFDSNGPFDGEKRDLWEGGFREPTIAYWPNQIDAGQVSEHPSAFYDWLATFADLAGVPTPAQSDGVSLAPTLTGVAPQPVHDHLYFEYLHNGNGNGFDQEVWARKGVTGRGQMQMIRIGDLAAVRYQISDHSTPLRLYDVVNDPFESNNLASDPQYSSLLSDMMGRLITSRRPLASINRPYDDEPLPAVSVDGLNAGKLKFFGYEGRWPWLPQFSNLHATTEGVADGLDLSKLPRDPDAGLLFQGFIEVPTTGAYTFSLTSDAGAQLWLHDALVIDDDYGHDGSEVSGQVYLAAGLHPLRVYYQHREGIAVLELTYTGPGVNKQPVPVTSFFVD